MRQTVRASARPATGGKWLQGQQGGGGRRRLPHETCPLSAGGGTRRVQSVRQGGGGRLGRSTGLKFSVLFFNLITCVPPAGSRRAWFEAALPLCRAALLNEMGRERAWAALGDAPVPAPSPMGEKDESCPVCTEGWTRRVHFVRGGGGGRSPARASPPDKAPDLSDRRREGRNREGAERAPWARLQ